MNFLKQRAKIHFFFNFSYFWSMILLFSIACNPKWKANSEHLALKKDEMGDKNLKIVVGAERFSEYLPLLKGKKVGMVVNQTSMIQNKHLVDTLLQQGVQVGVIFAPEHGFRGKADAGEKVNNSIDAQTGLPIISIYGKKNKPDSSDLKNIDVLLFDIQDVGARFYTYISTLQYIMEAGAEQKIPVVVLDRPNPNAHYVDGAILDKSLKSFVGMQPIPTVYGMTIGEYAKMLNEEGWLNQNLKCALTIIPCLNYNHNMSYDLPVKPSPNLPNLRSIYLYPSLCYFEGTEVSLGRGTNKQFQIYGAPNLPKTDFAFTPAPNEGSKEPPHKNKICNGWDLSHLKLDDLHSERQINLSYLINAYKYFPDKNAFFLKGNFFDKLSGTTELRTQLIQGKSADAIRASWQDGLAKFKTIRKKYLLYTDFE
jgi:uncharacterized protein YbbC (DUF1343 family)